MHWVSQPRPVAECDLDGHLLHPRFAVEQERGDGSVKIRAIDNFSWSPAERRRDESANGHTVALEKMEHDTLDDLLAALRCFRMKTGELPGLMKADIDAAFRRVPVCPEDRWAASVVFKVGTEVSDSSPHFGRVVAVRACAGVLAATLHMSLWRGQLGPCLGKGWRSTRAPGTCLSTPPGVPVRG